MSIENTSDGYQRKIFESRPGVWAVVIRHRLTGKGVFPELWSVWSWFGNASSQEGARAKHDEKLRSKNG